MKRPAAASAVAGDGAGEEDGDAEGRAGDGVPPPPMKKPAGKTKLNKRDLGFSAGKSMYKRDGVWSIKLNAREVIRVLRLHLTYKV